MVDIVPGPPEHTGLTQIDKAHTAQAVQVRGDTLPNLLTADEIATARVVKIDVEGAEYDVVASLAGMLHQFRDDCEFVVEVGPERAAGPEEVDALIAAFTSAGYAPYVLPNFYDVHSYMLRPVATSLPALKRRPEVEVDIVFSRHGDESLPM